MPRTRTVQQEAVQQAEETQQEEAREEEVVATASVKEEVKKKPSVFEVLNAIDVSAHVEKKQNLSYLAWAWAWAKLKEYYPSSYYTIYEDANGCLYHTDGKTCWVKTGVTVVDEDGVACEYIEYLPVMNMRNQSISLNDVTSFDANRAIQRALTKAIARHGLGLYIYAGEDLPEAMANEQKEKFEKITSLRNEAIAEYNRCIRRNQLDAMPADQRKVFDETYVNPIIGSLMNLPKLEDPEKLERLIENLKSVA